MDIPKDAGLESLANEDPANLIISRRVMVQPTSKLKDLGIKASPGQFIDKHAKVVFDSMDVVVLKSTKSRVLLPPFGSKEGNKPRCWSEDGIRPSTRVETPLSPTEFCKDCEHKGEDEQYNLLCYDVQLSQQNGYPNVFWFSAKKSSLGIVRSWLDSFRRQGKRPVDFKVTMLGEQGKSDKGNFFVVKFDDLQEIPSNIKNDVALAWHTYAAGSGDGEPATAEDVAEATGAF